MRDARQGFHQVRETPAGKNLRFKVLVSLICTAAIRTHGKCRRQCSILTQLRSGHVGLNRFLARIGAVDSPLCAVCRVPESVSHYLLTCRRYLAPRHTLRLAVSGPLSLRSTLGNPKARTAVLDFVEATGRFPAYSAQIP